MKTQNQLLAYIDGNHIGTFEERGGQLTFTYEPQCTLPISLSMPLGIREHKNRATSAFLWGLLPDNQQVLDNMAREAGTSASSAFGLLRFHGRDVAGALQLLPPNEKPTDGNSHSILEVSPRLSDHDIEDLLRQTMYRYQGKYTALPNLEDAFRFSVAGAQPKIALTADRTGKFLPPNKNFATTHIIKPNDPTSEYYFSDIDYIETLCLKAASKLGITTSDSYIWHGPSGNMQAMITQRYDRNIDSAGVVRRLHQEDFCQALSVMPKKKYQHRDGGPGVAEMSRIIRTSIPVRDQASIREKLFAAIVFNVGIVGTDAHAKNYSLLIGNSISLAPLYDSISAASHVHNGLGVHFPMKIGNTYTMSEITQAGLINAGTKLGLTQNQAENEVTRILTGIPQAISDVAKDLDQIGLGEQLINGIMDYSPVRWLVQR